MPDNHARDSDATDVADAWLVEHEGAPFGLRRVIIEGRDTVARSLRVREADQA